MHLCSLPYCTFLVFKVIRSIFHLKWAWLNSLVTHFFCFKMIRDKSQYPWVVADGLVEHFLSPAWNICISHIYLYLWAQVRVKIYPETVIFVLDNFLKTDYLIPSINIFLLTYSPLIFSYMAALDYSSINVFLITYSLLIFCMCGMSRTAIEYKPWIYHYKTMVENKTVPISQWPPQSMFLFNGIFITYFYMRRHRQ